MLLVLLRVLLLMLLMMLLGIELLTNLFPAVILYICSSDPK
uniref:Uncharacterized protein n=1 Tax=Picea glauca TaxID=3330 RepID=A0A101LX90_PICGL|nr:hypothetical protein ABT39_MTgene6030 [Picea glauca]QHR86818.1 hypothetical protein Q903MT_gene825 [Picea sitchensis]